MSRVDRSRKPYSRPSGDGQWLHDRAPGIRSKQDAAAALVQASATPSASGNTKLVVSNLHYEVMPKDLSVVFGQIGTLVREPLIKYDKSGRSSGVAIIAYETPAEAQRAKKEYEGATLKGEPMKITFEPPSVRRVSSAPNSLLNRIKAPLLERLSSKDDTSVKNHAVPKGPRAGPGPVRTKARGGRGERGERREREPKKAKTAEELDNELDAYLGEGPPAKAEGDVEMA